MKSNLVAPPIIPETVVDRDSFRDWVASPAFPDEVRVAYLDGKVWLDVMSEQLFSHNQVKGAFAVALGQLATTRDLGLYFHDRCQLTHDGANLVSQPDGTFVAW